MKTRKYQADTARLVITFEVKVNDAYMRSLPGWRRSAMSVLRELVAQEIPLGELVTRLRRQSTRYTIVNEKVEVAS